MSQRVLGLGRAGGQAMVEVAILILVVTLLIAGGIELGMAAFSGQRAAEGSRAAVEEWMYAVGNAGVYVPATEGSEEEARVSFDITNSPVGVGSSLGEGVVGLGDHEEGLFRRPTCDPSDPTLYDDGLPSDSVTNGGSAVYLFNPLPIDITNCAGPEGNRISALIERLPALNRAIYPLYQRRCGDAAGNEIACSDTANAVTTFARLPGRLDPESDTVLLAMLDGDPDSPTFQLPLSDSPRAVFEIECAEPGSDIFRLCDSATSADEVCWENADTPIACDIRVRVRYRSIFHALLQYPFVYWNSPLPPEALEQMDLGPVGSNIGVAGSEVARGNVRRMQRTFLGCWETVTVAPTAGMRGQRTSRACN